MIGFGELDLNSNYNRGLLNKILKKIISNKNYSNFEVILQILLEYKVKLIKGKEKGRKGNNKFKKLFKFFNIYANLYLAGNIIKYIIIINSNILISELKYKYILQSLNYRS